jgi:hypothetical protein
MKILELPLLGSEPSDRSRWDSAMRAATPSSPRVITFAVRACRQPPYSYVCGPLPRPLRASSLFSSQGTSLYPKRRLTPSRWNSLRSRGLHMEVRGTAEQAESTETKQFKKSRGPLLSAREAGPRTEPPANETLKRGGREGPLGLGSCR